MPPAARSSSTSATGRRSVAEVMAEQASRLAYAHGSAFTTEPLEAYAAEIARHLPVHGPAIYPVSGGSEAIETALKLARAYHLANGEPAREIVIAGGGATTATPSAPSTSRDGRPCAGRTSRGWVASGTSRPPTRMVPTARAGTPSRTAPHSRPSWTRRSRRPGPGTVAAFVAEPIVGATLAAAVPPEDYWPRIAEVCARHGVLLIADEVMTGFGRTGRWFASRPLGTPAGHARRRQGRDVGLLAVRVRRRLRGHPRRGDGRRRVRARVHLLAPAGRGRRRPRGPADPRNGGPRRRERDQG